MVLQFPEQMTLERAWEIYVSLVRDRQADETLQTDVQHCIKCARAWNVWQRLFLEQEAA